MGRGKIEIKKIENTTNRQVTYSKRRSGITKKAHELTVLCDAEVLLVMFSSTDKLFEYCSSTTNTKKILDRYQQTTGIDLWNYQYKKMQDHLNHLKEINKNLCREIRQRSGGELGDLDFEQLRGLEQKVDSALKLVRLRKEHVITTQSQTSKKRIRQQEEAHSCLLRALGEREPGSDFSLGDNGTTDFDSSFGLANGGQHMLAFRLQPIQPNLHNMGFNTHDLRLA
ncbi:MADS-box transcription factor 16 [Acorus gramineus]|uniref:MADS-box transcription factor 16 n=1 Tax=Acorus gramineus TaxID=55184 RepID=A0AAV9BBY3_ACOGR|nr:MADS-box transcription factor 16 [Acorus gramineus]